MAQPTRLQAPPAPQSAARAARQWRSDLTVHLLVGRRSSTPVAVAAALRNGVIGHGVLELLNTHGLEVSGTRAGQFRLEHGLLIHTTLNARKFNFKLNRLLPRHQTCRVDIDCLAVGKCLLQYVATGSEERDTLSRDRLAHAALAIAESRARAVAVEVRRNVAIARHVSTVLREEPVALDRAEVHRDHLAREVRCEADEAGHLGGVDDVEARLTTNAPAHAILGDA
mmetsp:Transcript_5448/g.11117  ORF Transcript_5448/g.11117 Transcript_5448/m.11117 type:complete len:226 (+) Transcript_5448:59-736(+)